MPTLSLIVAFSVGIGCHHTAPVLHPEASVAAPDQKRVIPLVARISDAGEPLDENGVAITKEGIEAKLAIGTLDRSTPVRIAVKGTQKKGVLETSEMFTSLGFRSVTIELTLEDPIR